MTRNHGYNSPTAGTTDWHIPLNDNFEKLDVDVEIRDSEASLGDYEPKVGAKFMATDTEKVYLGDGTRWQAVDSTGRDASFETVNKVRFAGPGSVQAKIDAAASSGSGTVRLEPETTYDPGTPWAVKGGVTLDCTGATIAPTADVDLFHVHPDARVQNPVVDLSNVTYTSNVFTFDGTSLGNYDAEHNTRVSGGKTTGSPGSGTLFYFTQHGSYDYVSFVRIDSQCDGIGTVVDIYGQTSTGWINDNTVAGTYRDFGTGIHIRGKGDLWANEFDMMSLQTTEGTSDRGIFFDLDSDAGGKVTGNYFHGYLWDPFNYSRAAIEYTSNGPATNTVIETINDIDVSRYVIDNSGVITNTYRSLGINGSYDRVYNTSGDAQVSTTWEGDERSWYVSSTIGGTETKALGLSESGVSTPNDLSLDGSRFYGIRHLSSPSASDLWSGELAWDTSNNRLLFKDNGGSAYFFNADGRL